jgi:Nuclease-related domain
LKQKDDITPQIMALETLRVRPDLSDSQREEIEGELWTLRSGARGEREAAHHLDFQFGDRASLAVIHDLRIEHKGRVTQIDHLILNRLLDIHVLESKDFSGDVRVSAEGEWEICAPDGWHGIPSPVERNRHHIEVLTDYIRDNDLAPRRAGFLPLNPTFHGWVLVPPRCDLKKSGEEWQNVVKMDMFVRQFEKQIDEAPALSDFVSVAKVVSTDTLFPFANSLVAAHRPAHIDYHAQFCQLTAVTA